MADAANARLLVSLLAKQAVVLLISSAKTKKKASNFKLLNAVVINGIFYCDSIQGDLFYDT